ncbi:MAG: hypothetical protein GY756_03505, partial [bacterium]|nr:hypothetical protein [bacterium]
SFCFNCNAKMFATFNLKVENHTKTPIKAVCIAKPTIDDLCIYSKDAWIKFKNHTQEIPPNGFIMFHIGAYCTIDKLLWFITYDRYINRNTLFTLTVYQKKNNSYSDKVNIIWKGDHGEISSSEQHTRFYFYQYTGSFIFEGVTLKSKKAKPNFYIYGSANFNSPDYKNNVIITSDNLWSPESGYYLIEVNEAKSENEENKLQIYSPLGNNKILNETAVKESSNDKREH